MTERTEREGGFGPPPSQPFRLRRRKDPPFRLPSEYDAVVKERDEARAQAERLHTVLFRTGCFTEDEVDEIADGTMSTDAARELALERKERSLEGRERILDALERVRRPEAT